MSMQIDPLTGKPWNHRWRCSCLCRPTIICNCT